MKHDHRTSLTESDFRKSLSKINLTNNEISLLKVLYEAPNHKATGLELMDILNKKHSGGINLTFARIAQKISKETDVLPASKRKNGNYRWWSLLAIGEEEGKYFSWELRPEFIGAIEKENILNQKIKFKFNEVFPVIRAIVRKKNFSQLWVSRDEIANELKKDNFIKGMYLDGATDIDWVAGNMVDWFSASFTRKTAIIQEYLLEFERGKIEKVNPKGHKRKIWAYRIKNTLLTEEFEEFNTKHIEGKVSKVFVNRYERDSAARIKCINHFGTACQVCEFNFEDKFGEIGKDFIHVHHLKEISSIAEEYEVNPIEDLIPVCPNCHAMLHKRKPAFKIEELKRIMKTEQNKA
ncbi:MAG: HNH endonuclease [Saprospiraceae bacterium]